MTICDKFVRAEGARGDMVEAMADAVCSARCDPSRPDPGKGLDEYIAKAALSVVLDRLRIPDDAAWEAYFHATRAGSLRDGLRAIADHIAKDAGI